MGFSALARWFWSRSHAATTWQSGKARNALVLLGPCMPQPTTPRVTRSDGAFLPPRPSALRGTNVGRAMAAPAAVRKWRRLTLALNEGFFIVSSRSTTVLFRPHGKDPAIMPASVVIAL